MTQRIVIKTKVTDAQSQPKQANSVSYQYHWRRIFTVLAMMSFGVMALSYGVFKSVYADDLTSLPSEPAIIAPQVVDATDTQVSELSASAIQISETVIEEPQVPALISQNSESTGLEQSATLVANVASGDEDILEIASENTEQTQTSPPQLQEEASVTRFADDAQIASVALNAKVDTSHISRAVLTSGIENREPVNVLKHLVEQNRFEEKLYFFTEIKGLQGEVVQHLWFHQEQLMAEITLAISAPRFRTYSSKNIMPSQTGQWRVEVITQNGQLLAQKSFRILAKAP
ncbi:DUF2914 domain-containing protein [Pseudoalteromonas luteoviolacea]|uniref:DUF2914 domain-containing protein n=1 Tax=Pseudoalteromonas luteoviolacea NCIMB 1942 TaxID=1365253 RepID=A0A167H5T8_9GAMM|nr:DUF2914 domain-containing protein [Pseudoalteromonas luteoviolacea]KZN57663.1 hypothetical protein N482_23355 [Pseudoalteromonas luteoviolacea NCIMB 1942]